MPEDQKVCASDNYCDRTVIGLPCNLFISTGIPVCILVLKKERKDKDILFINAQGHFGKGKRENRLREGVDGDPNDIEEIVNCYRNRSDNIRYFPEGRADRD
ncbi:N-6 DNA methylase [Bathymodiolus japonicus methanotrophic gill symbiont]|uniref:N-6 DNA methylase n=1 Tax=Bathymodiolus japonicus methanotrophic gill symbiont TaxID=113269 RepID=UPI001E28B796|nr:N-6 DNA methylase [Bathymodiolus japonicus methanotrophic gill symbiont]